MNLGDQTQGNFWALKLEYRLTSLEARHRKSGLSSPVPWPSIISIAYLVRVLNISRGNHVSGWPPTHKGPSSLGLKEAQIRMRQDSEAPSSLFALRLQQCNTSPSWVCREVHWTEERKDHTAVRQCYGIYCQIGRNPVPTWIGTAGGASVLWAHKAGVQNHPSKAPDLRGCLCLSRDL